MVEFFSLEMLFNVCKYLSCKAAGLSLNVSAASFNALDAFISPSAAITFARASLLFNSKQKKCIKEFTQNKSKCFSYLAASASVAIALCSCVGRETSLLFSK